MENLIFDNPLPAVHPVSDLRIYGEVLSEVDKGNIVILTKNGRSKYVVMSTEDFDLQQQVRTYEKLITKLNAATMDYEKNGGYTIEEVMTELRDPERKRNV